MSLTVEEIKIADYSTLVGLVRERNRPSGGIRTLVEFAQKSFLRPDKNLLEVGSNTGFSVVNIASITGSFCSGIDINPISIKEAMENAKSIGVEHLTEFKIGNALEIPYTDEYFDTLWVSNVTSFIEDKCAAFREYLRVLKKGGFIGIAPIYYREQPPSDLFRQVEQLLNAKITIRSLDSWKKEIERAAAETKITLIETSCSDYLYLDQDKNIDRWLLKVLDKPHLKELPKDKRNALVDRYSTCMRLFNENLKYCGFSLIIYQKRAVPEEPELFLTRSV